MRMALTRGEEGDELRSIPLIPQVQPTPRVLVRGERGILTRIAPCCQPVPGDPVKAQHPIQPDRRYHP